MAKWGEIKCPRCEMLEEHLCLTEEKLAKAKWFLIDAAVQLEEGKIRIRRNRAALIWQFIAELTGGGDE